MVDKIEIGKVVKLRGFRGEIVVETNLGSTKFLDTIIHIIVDETEYNIVQIKRLNERIGFLLEGINSDETASKFLNKTVYIYRDEIEISENEFLVDDVIGFKIFDENNKFIGQLTEVLNYGANDVYVLNNGKNEVILGYRDDLVKLVDYAEKKIIVFENVLKEVIVWE